MITPISSHHTEVVRQSPEPPAPRPEPKAPAAKSGALSSDQVTLKNAGEVDAEGAD